MTNIQNQQALIKFASYHVILGLKENINCNHSRISFHSKEPVMAFINMLINVTYVNKHAQYIEAAYLRSNHIFGS